MAKVMSVLKALRGLQIKSFLRKIMYFNQFLLYSRRLRLSVCLSAISTVFHNATLDNRIKKYGFCDKKNSAVTIRLKSYGKPNTALNFLTK